MKAWIALVFVAACGGASGHASMPAADNARLLGGGARRYNEPLATAPSDPVSDAVLTATREIAAHDKVAAPVPDARLFAACAALARVTPDNGLLAYPVVTFALQSNGIIEPSPHILAVRGDLRQPVLIAAALRPAIGEALAAEPITRVGIGSYGSGEDGVVVVALQESHVQTSAIPRAVAADGRVDFDFELDAGYGEPHVSAIRPSGQVVRAQVEKRDTAYHVEIACRGERGPMHVELSAVHDDDFPMLASFPVWCDDQPPASIAVSARPNDAPADPRDAEKGVLSLVNARRAQAATAPLVWDDELAASARAHSEQMRSTGHVIDVAQPDAAHALQFSTVARTYGVEETAQGMLGIASGRMLLLSPNVTRIGIGIVYGNQLAGGARALYVTVTVSVAVRHLTAP